MTILHRTRRVSGHALPLLAAPAAASAHAVEVRPPLEVRALFYRIDQNDPAVQGYRLENHDFGLRLTGGRPLPGGIRTTYAASYARQRDLHATLAPAWMLHGRIGTVGLDAPVHRRESDREVRHYGDELDLLATFRTARPTITARDAACRSATFGTDVRQFWLSTECSL